MKQLLSINIITALPLWLGVFCMMLGGVYAFLLYRKEEKFIETANWLVKLMAVLRFLLVSILAFFLLSPFIKTLFNKVEKPVIIIAQDNSSSLLLNKDSVFYKTQYLEKVKKLKSNLEEKYEVKTYTFGENLTEGLAVDFTEKITHFSNVFEALENKYYNRNVGALILASDGIYNQGANPVYNSNIAFPVYTIAMGDTALQKDVVLKDVVFNKLTFLGNKFPIEIDAVAYQCNGNKTKLTVTHKGKELFTQNYNLNTNDYNINSSVLIEAKEVGMQHYQIQLSNIEGEMSVVNNTKDIYIEVLDGRQNVLVLANAPHPDVKALKRSIETNENYKVTHQLTKDFNGNIAAYSLVIIHQTPKAITPALKKLLSSDVSVLYFLGSQTISKVFNTMQSGLNISKTNNQTNEILPALSSNFSLFTLLEKTTKSLKQMPPVVGPFGEFKMNANGYVLLNQKIGSVTTTAPLMVFFQHENKKEAVFAAEGIWKWRMQDFLKNKNHDSFDELINKTVQFLSVKEDKGKFRVFSENIFFENQEIRFDAELYNDSYELINDPEISLNLLAKEGNDYSFVFNRTSNAYVLNAGILPPGIYDYDAKVTYGNKTYKEHGKLQINPLLLEANNTRANHQLLQNMAQKFGGKLFLPTNINELEKELINSQEIAATIYEEQDLKSLIDLKWIFFFLLSLLSLEWFLRKRNGAY